MSVTLIVDIGSSSVGAVLVSVSKNTTPKILFSSRCPAVLSFESDRSRSLSAVTTALEQVMTAVAANHAAVHVAVHKTHIVFSAPWYTCQTKIIKTEHDSPILVTQHVIEQLIKESENKFLEEFKIAGGEFVEHRIIHSNLNGYDTPDPYNKKAKTIELAFFASVIAKDILDSVSRVVKKHFHTRDYEVSSFPLIAFSSISRILPAEKNFLIVDIRGEVTDLSLITDGVLMKNMTFPQGKNALVKAMSAVSGQSETATLSLLSTAFHGNAEPATQAEVAKFTEPFKQVWIQTYTKTLQDIISATTGTSVNAFPPAIFLLADQDTETFFKNILSETNKNNKLYLLKDLEAHSFLDGAAVLTDPFLALESIFVTMV